jgi:hypothetical protein
VGLRLRIQNERTIYLTYKPVKIISMSCCETLKIDIEHVIKADDILNSPFKSRQKSIRYVLSGGWDATNSQFMQLIVRSISLPVPFIMQSPF